MRAVGDDAPVCVIHYIYYSQHQGITVSLNARTLQSLTRVAQTQTKERRHSVPCASCRAKNGSASAAGTVVQNVQYNTILN